MNSPDNSQKEGKKVFLPTIGSTSARNPPIADSTINWPLVGMSLGVLTNILTRIIIKIETTQLVIIELVMGNEPIRVISVEVKLTPSPAEKAFEHKTV